MSNASSIYLASGQSKTKWLAAVVLSTLAIGAQSLLGQSLGYEGPTGIFVTPLASTAPSPAHGLGRPSVAYHFIDGGPVLGEYSMVSITEGFHRYFEVGYTRAIHAGGNDAALSPMWTDGYNVFHGKATVLPAGAFHQKWMPAVGMGGILRTNVQNVGGEINKKSTNNGDAYVTLTKVLPITEKVPLLLNAGVRGTNASLWGLGGNAPAFSAAGFGSAGLVFPGPAKSSIVLAAEVAQQPQRVQVVSSLDIPTSLVYAVRVTPSPKHKLNLDAGLLQAAGRVAPGIDLQARARFAFGISYGF